MPMLVSVLLVFTASGLAPWVYRLTGHAAGLVLAIVPLGLAAYFALFWDYSNGVNELKRVLNDSGKPFIPLPKLMGDAIDQYNETTSTRFIELGMLFDYLRRFRVDTATAYDADGNVIGAPFEEYLAALLAGKNVTRDPVHLLLTTQAAAVEADFKAFEFPLD